MTKSIGHPWDGYARLQRDLASTSQFSHAWGLESGLNYIIDSKANGDPIATADVLRAIATGRRRERHRSAIAARKNSGAVIRDRATRRLTPVEPARDTHNLIEARSEVALISQSMTESELQLAQAVAAGYEYGELAGEAGTTAGALRVRMARLRSKLSGIGAGTI